LFSQHKIKITVAGTRLASLELPLLKELTMIANLIDLSPRERRYESAASGSVSAIELRFPRIARELASRWEKWDIDAYLDHLLIDERGNRMGFPADVLEEIMFLAGIRWYLGHSNKFGSLESPRDEFSFCTDDFRRCGTTGGWVLT
jgi:hypothetical protein